MVVGFFEWFFWTFWELWVWVQNQILWFWRTTHQRFIYPTLTHWFFLETTPHWSRCWDTFWMLEQALLLTLIIRWVWPWQTISLLQTITNLTSRLVSKWWSPFFFVEWSFGSWWWQLTSRKQKCLMITKYKLLQPKRINDSKKCIMHARHGAHT
jgi:hypothetical protein